ncbi:glycosyltransferase [Polynucleobacter sp. 80A-SIGWE]|uniref:glycosyltransferase family 2 protein n=1 Tax=Polynucleobacter sp. 80A-SIGWE TaxID=2689100 RepID=UPI001C0CCE54|nr:glycosyltransferase [Polynucleobacter sp. 80A-SIGWE]MBU3589073.1 glycosyltransferase [Polynucleobacter sp. 80A-SIGWE]
MLTVLIPNLNSGELWLRTFRGISRVANKVDKVIIIDGYSIDNSSVLLRDSLLKINIPSDIRKFPPKGIINAIRSGINLVNTSHVLINLCGDELLSLPNSTNEVFEYIEFGSCDILNDKNQKIGNFIENNMCAVRYRMPHINMNSVIWPLSFLKNSNSINYNYKIASDHALFLEAFTCKIPLKYNAQIKSIFYKDGISSRPDMYAFGLGEGFYLTSKYGNFLSSITYYLYCLVFRGVNLRYFWNGFMNAKGLNK